MKITRVSKPYRYARKVYSAMKIISPEMKFQNLIGMLGRVSHPELHKIRTRFQNLIGMLGRISDEGPYTKTSPFQNLIGMLGSPP